MALLKILSRLFRSDKERQAVFQKVSEEGQGTEPMEKFLVAGLGNIGQEYAQTRHNMGFMVLDEWAKAAEAVFSTERYGSIATVSVKGRQFWLLKPSTYMNLRAMLSGIGLRSLIFPWSISWLFAMTLIFRSAH